MQETQRSLNSNSMTYLLVRKGFFALIPVLIGSPLALASSNYNDRSTTAIKNVYGASANWGGTCTTCHGSIQPNIPANGFGRQFTTNGGRGGNSTTVANFQTIYTAIQGLDADGDMATNQQEFMAGTDPGDPLSKPGASPTPKPTPVPTPKPSATPTPPPGSGVGTQSSKSTRMVGGCGSASSTGGTSAASLGGFGGMGSVVLCSLPLFTVWVLRRRRDED